MRRIGLFALSLAGLWNALYLLWAYTTPSIPMTCVGDGCDAVRASEYAFLWGVPLPAFGVAMFLTLALLVFIGPLLNADLERLARYALVAISGFGFAFSLYLTALEAFVIRAWCFWCVVSAVLITVIFALAVLDMVRPRPRGAAAGPPAALAALRGFVVTAVIAVALGVPAFILLMRQAAVEPLEVAAGEGVAERLVRPDSHITGNALAPVTVVEWADFQCPACSRAEETAREIRRQYGDRVRFVFRQFPLERLHPHARRAAEASECAGEQGKFWEAVEKFFDHQEDLSEAAMVRSAGEMRLDVERFRECLASARMAARVERDVQDARALGLRATPTFFVGRTVVEGPLAVRDFARLVEAELARAKVTGPREESVAATPPGPPSNDKPPLEEKSGTSAQAPEAAGQASAGSGGGLSGFGTLRLGGGAFSTFQSSATTCSEEDLARQQPDMIHTAQARQMFERDSSALFVDVRPAREFATRRIRGAVSIPVEEIEQRWSELPQDREIVLYESGKGRGDDLCAAAVAAGRVLLARGFAQERVKVFQDGLAAWERSGLPVEP